ncbi:tRNA(Ile)-lysidine synthase [Williamsia serinedens]|uniref:tRNA(Ile)-lysidine synthase n=1 Tax=Williamsia serinedens TaxID=391736 RepID=A0ABT1H4Z4_9NOCA|nr:tRNA lysidine(34) synthetase TilS [Williamsia serinedens]MCP2161658.1 tRNA(Ile)-lysidine synthase [Williamsia serinedens]
MGAALDAIGRAVSGLLARESLGDDVCVALSGGPDSTALLLGARHVGLTVTALVVDHGMQDGSAEVARSAARTAVDLGAQAQVMTVDVDGPGGPEAAARRARYAALDEARVGRPVLLGHTLDDQAETVLVGLARGSGPRSIAGMVAWDEPWGRPLLATRRATTVAACAEAGLTPWADPHNDDPRFLRSRVRAELVPVMQTVLGAAVVPALARTADLVRDDLDALDAVAAAASETVVVDGAVVRSELVALPRAIRRRVLRRWLIDGGASEVTAPLLAAVDDLADDTAHGAVAVGGDVDVRVNAVADGGLLRLRRDRR